MTVEAALDRGAACNTPEPDLARVLDEELDRLPTRFRLPVVLCEVHERTVAQAAAELGLPVGTLASRLSGGRGSRPGCAGAA